MSQFNPVFFAATKKERIESLERIVSEICLKIFGTEVYLDKPLASRLAKLEQETRQLARRMDLCDDAVENLLEKHDK